MSREALKQEYDYWLKVKDNFEKNTLDKPLTSDETANYNFAVGFVSAINKSAIFKD